MDQSYRSQHETSRPHNPWQKFLQRHDAKHQFEDTSRLCTASQITSEQVIEMFLTHDKTPLDEQIPRRRQRLRDFLYEVVSPSRGTSGPYLTDVDRRSADADIALIDDRQKHDKCVKASFGDPCGACCIFSKRLSVPDLCRRLGGKVSRPPKNHLFGN